MAMTKKYIYLFFCKSQGFNGADFVMDAPKKKSPAISTK